MVNVWLPLKLYWKQNLTFTDTDSLTYEIKSEDVYEEFFEHLFDFSNHSKRFKVFWSDQ